MDRKLNQLLQAPHLCPLTLAPGVTGTLPHPPSLRRPEVAGPLPHGWAVHSHESGPLVPAPPWLGFSGPLLLS